MNILHLKYVISIAENGSINRAAEERHAAQPNLSRVVREMEADLGGVQDDAAKKACRTGRKL